MNTGTIVVYLSFVFALFTLILCIINLISKWRGKKLPEKIPLITKFFSILFFFTLTVALLLLYIYFITSNMDIMYVWEYSSTQAPFEYKIAGVLAGMQGSLLFWIWCMGLSLFVEEIVDFRKPKSSVLMNLTRAIMMIIIAIFLYFLITRDLFAETPKYLLDARPKGYGLNPLLQTPLMITHPPIVFLAYGFIVIAMASSMAYLICDEKDWVKLSMPWSRWAWLFLTLGIGIGGLWAYVVLGWGGYWAWDPVETSSFLPWILLTAFLHAQLMFKRKGDYKLAAPALGIYTFVLVIFATFTTRAGGIWLSVHAFGQANVQGDAYDRFISALSDDIVIMGYFLLMIGVAILGAILLIWSMVKRGEAEDHSQTSERGFLEEIINDRSLMFITLIVFTISTIVTLLLLIMAVNGLDRTQFDTRVGFFAMIGVIVLIACLIWKYLGIKATAYSLLFTMGISLILWLLYPDYGIVVATIPFLALALGASIYKIIKSINKKSLRGSINGIAPHLIHLGVVFILIGFVASNFLSTEKTVTLDLNGDSKNVGNYDLKMVGGEYVHYDSIFAEIEISQNGNVIGTAEPGGVFVYKYLFSLDSLYEQYLIDGYVDFNMHMAFQENNLFLSRFAYIYMIDTDKWLIEDFDNNNLQLYQVVVTESELEIYSDRQWRNEVSVHSTLLEDVYLIFNDDPISSSTFTQVEFQVKVLPLMSILWIGMWLMAIGIIMRLIVEFTRFKGKSVTRVSRRARMRDEEEEGEEEEGEEEEGEEEREEEEKEEEEGEREEEEKEEGEGEREEEKDIDYYEDLIEKELKEMD